MKIAIIGATGFVGTNLVNELINRNHTVLGISRRANTSEKNNLTFIRRDVLNVNGKPLTELEIVLKANGIEHIVLTGIATSGAVLSTVRTAADMDYKITVLSDGCADADEEKHNFLITKILPGQADVHTIEEWADRL